jgi:serine/threonine protein kinase
MQAPYAPSAPVRLGPYELLQRLATGGMAEIYIARREGPHGFSKRIALKRILPQLAADPEFVAMFIDEARVCAQLTHPNLVEVFDFGEEGCELYMAMELIEGTTAAKVVRTAATRGELVPAEVALYVALSVGRGLTHAHEACDQFGRSLGLIHRDVSPGNILISGAGAVKLGDFGIVRGAEFERRTEEGQLKGKLGYMSPEQVTGKELDSKSDQFSAGIVLAELLMARPLFAGAREMEVLVKIRDADVSVLDRHAHRLPPEIVAVVRRMLARRPEERFPTTRAYVEALEEVVRRKRLNVTPAVLVEWLYRVGLVRAAGTSGEHSVELSVAPPVAPSRASRDKMQAAVKASASRLVAERPVPPPEESLPATDAAHSIYRVALPEGAQSLTLSSIMDLLVAGRVLGTTPISRDSGPFIPAREFPELGRCCGISAARWDEMPPPERSFSRAIRLGTLPAKLYELALRRATGMLVVQDGDIIKKSYLVEGVPEVTTSNDPSELFGALLVSKGLAVPMEIEMALALAPRYGGRLGDALVGLEVLRPMDLARAIVDHMRRRFVQVAGWKKGQMRFVEGARHPGPDEEDTMPEALHPLELVTRGVLESYTEQDFVKLVSPLEASLIFPLPRAPISSASLGLPTAEAVVMRAADGRRHTVADLAALALARGGCDRVSVLRGIFLGLASGILVSPAWPPPDGRESLPTLPDS